MAATTPLPHDTPLAVIERTVQHRAAQTGLDMTAPDAPTTLRRLITDAIDAWADDTRRGLRPFPIADPDRLAQRAYDNLAGYGPLQPLLDDPDVWEIMINGPETIFARRHTGPSGYHDDTFHDDDHVHRTITKLLHDAGSHRKLDPAEGLQDAQLAGGARLHLAHPDLTRGGHLIINIRKFTGVQLRSLDELVTRGMLTTPTAAFLRATIDARATTVFAGAPGSGKTTLLSCCTAELDPRLRVVTAEEVFEVDIPLANVASLQTRAPRPDRPEINLRHLVAAFLRMSPDIAIVGEVRDREALPLLLTLSSGVKGYTTIHAGSARQALTRLRFICQLADAASDLPLSALNTLVSESIDLVVHCGRGPRGPVVDEIVAVEDLAGGPEATQFTVTELFARPTPTSPLVWTGHIPARLGRLLAQRGHDIRSLLRAAEAPFEARSA